MRSPVLRLLALLVAAPLLPALLLVGCRGGLGAADAAEETPFLNARDSTVAFVGDEACASCHEDLYRRYQTHGMARSFYRLTPENAVEDFAGVVVADEAGGYYYTARREGDRFVQEEYRLGPGGEKTHRLVRTMDYVVGSGSAARTYLAEVEGRLYELPLTWYTQANDGAGRWDFSPGYRENNARFDRAIPDRCMACHNGYSPPVPGVEGAFASLEDGIGCEQCHGPGALHVEARLAEPEAPDSVDYTIVNPAHLDLGLRLDVCQQCHLSGAVSVLREGATAFGYRPSTPLEDHRAVFALAETDDARVSVISHADRMQRSACFIESGAMDCVTCHDPHEGFRDKGPSFFNATCQGCHAPAPLQQAMPTPELRAQHAPAADCASCHMPKVEADDAPHSSFTDHLIRVVRDDEIEGTTAEARGAALEPYFPRDQRDGTVAQAYAGIAYVVYGRQRSDADALRRGVGLLDEALGAETALGEAQYLLGFARLQLGQAAEAVPALEEAVRLGPQIPERANTLAQAYERLGRDPARTEQLYREALAAQPAAAAIRVNLGRFLEARGRLAEATAEYRRAAADDPTLATAHYNLGTALLQQNDAAGAEAALREAVRLEPRHADALTNLGVLVAMQGDAREAERLFVRAVEADPQNASAQANLGTYFLQRGDLARALAPLAEATRLDPRNADAHANLAAVLIQTGRPADAAQAAQTALALNPGHPLARQVMAALQGG